MGTTKHTVEQEAQMRYESAFEMLACRCLGEPYNFHRVAPMLLPGLLNSGLHSAKIVAACLAQANKSDGYTPQSIALECGIPPAMALEMAQRDAEMTLTDAIESFLLYHGQWAELRLSTYTESWVRSGLTADEMQAEREKARKDFGLAARLTSSDGKEEFEAKLLAAIDGIQYTYPVTPYLRAMRESVPFYEPGDYIVTAALTGQGKTYDVLNQILHNALNGVPSCYINLENTPANVQKRLWQMVCGVWFKSDLRGTDEQMREYLRVWEMIKKLPIYSYNPGRELNGIVSTIRQAWYEHGVQFAGIDYAQLMRIAGYKGARNYELGEISGTIRSLALDLKIPINALAQFKQEVSKTAEKRGGLYDIKDCADFAQDATIVKTLYRPGYFDISVSPDGQPYPDNYADHFIAKGRETGPFLVCCRFDPIKGFYDIPNELSIPTYEPTFDPSQARPKKDQDIPF